MLISCPECNREISDQAASCPHCGCPINEQPKAEPKVIETVKVVEEKKGFGCGGFILALIVGFFILIILGGMSGGGRSTPTNSTPSSTKKADNFYSSAKEHAELLEEASAGLGADVEWSIDGHKLTFDYTIEFLSTTDLALTIVSDGGIESLEELRDMISEGVEAMYKNLKSQGYSDCKVLGTVYTSDGQEMFVFSNDDTVYDILS